MTKAPTNESDLRIRFAAKLRTLRIARGLTQMEIALSADVGQSTVSEWENGQTWPEPEQIERLVGALCVTPEELFA